MTSWITVQECQKLKFNVRTSETKIQNLKKFKIQNLEIKFKIHDLITVIKLFGNKTVRSVIILE